MTIGEKCKRYNHYKTSSLFIVAIVKQIIIVKHVHFKQIIIGPKEIVKRGNDNY